MSNVKDLPTLKIDGFSFLGGGVRCAPGQYAVMCTIMHKLKIIPEEILHYTKYLSCNSGGAFTMATLLCYPNMKTLWPLDKVKDLSQADLETFYQKYWIQPTKDALDKIPDIKTNPAVFAGASGANVGIYSWVNALSTLAIVPFSDAIGDIAFKDVPLAKNEKKVISFGATANAKSNIRTSSGSVVDMDVYLSSVEYEWSKDYSQIPGGKNQNMVGFPVNLNYGFGNPVVNDATFFNGDMAQITYTQSSTPMSECNIGSVIKKFLPFLKPKTDLHRQSTSDPSPPSPSTVTPPNITLGKSQIGESPFLTLVGASSSFIGCSPQSIPGIDMQECDNNFLNYDQAIIMDMHNGNLVLNSKGKLNKPNTLPYTPWKDNGTLDLNKTPKPNLINLCDGTNSYDNTGIIPMIRAWQMYEQPQDLKTKTYNIFYMDGIDPGDIAAHADIPSYSHFAKLFSQGDGANTPRPDYGLVIFDSSVNGYEFVWESKHAKDSEGNDVYMKLFYYQGLVTQKNDFVGVEAGIKINLVVLNPYTNMDTKYGTYQDLDNYGTINKLLIRACQDLDTQGGAGWVNKLFQKPPPTFGCFQNQCMEGHGHKSQTECISTCNHKPPPPPPIATYGCVTQDGNSQCVQGKGDLNSAQCALACNHTPGAEQSIQAFEKAFPFILVIVALFLVIAIVAHRHHEIHYSSSSASSASSSRKRKAH